MTKRSIIAVLATVLAMSLSACGGGSGEVQPPTGDVAIIFTDGPTDQYERILVSMTGMTLIGPGGQVDLYDGPEVTFDLLQMSDWGDLAFNTKVLAGQYNKIRLVLSKVELVNLDTASGQPESETLDALPANGKVDLNPRGPFEVSPEYTTVIKLDMDAKRSFQVVQTGNNKLKLRPIIFVEVYEGDIFLSDRLVRVRGTAQEDSFTNEDVSDAANDSFRLCNLEFISQTNGPSGSDPNCVRIYTVENNTGSFGRSGIFDGSGMAADFAAIAAGQTLTAVGFVVDSADGQAFLGLSTAVVEIGDRSAYAVGGGWDTVRGIVEQDQTSCNPDQCFPYIPVEDLPDGAITTRMQVDTKVFRADGVVLAQADVSMDDTGSIDAYRADMNGELYAALVVLGTDVGSGAVTGSLQTVDPIGGTAYTKLQVLTDAGGMFDVCVDSETEIVQVLADDELVTLLDVIDPSVLETGSVIEAFGDTDPPPPMCDMLADQVIVEPSQQ